MGDRRRITAPIKVREVEVGNDVIDHGPGQWGLLENVQNTVCLGTVCVVARCKYVNTLSVQTVAYISA